MLMVSSTGLWAKLYDLEEGVRFFPIVAITYAEDAVHFTGIMAIEKEMYPAPSDDQFVGYVTSDERLAHYRAMKLDPPNTPITNWDMA